MREQTDYSVAASLSRTLTTLTSFFRRVCRRGLLELSKSFLDPFGNRRVSASGLSADISISTLIGEANAGSLVWPQGANRMPFHPGEYVPKGSGGGGGDTAPQQQAATGDATAAQGV